jgi:PAS domain S-box-containing protein
MADNRGKGLTLAISKKDASPAGPLAALFPKSAVNSDLFRLLVESVRDYAIFMLDPGGHIISWNEGAQRLKGYSESEIVGQHFSIFYPQPAKDSKWPEYELEVAGREGRFEDEGWRVRKDGTQFWANVVITAMRDASGELRGFAKVTRDLTERRRSEDALRLSEERYRLLVEGVRDYAIFMLDVNGNVASWNRGAERLKGYSAEEILGSSFSVFFPQEARAANAPEYDLQLAREQGRSESEGWRVRKNGTMFWASVVMNAVYGDGGGLHGFSMLTRDVTEKKKFEDALQSLNGQLRQRVEQLANANRSLSEKSLEIETFVYSVSHDVRGPLVNLQGFTRELQQSCEDLLKLIDDEPDIPPGVKERARRIVSVEMEESTGYLENAVLHLGNIVDALLRLSRLGRVVYQFQPVDVRALVERVVTAARSTIEHGHAQVAIGELPMVVADATALEQVFGNLVANALRYRDPERECRIEIGGTTSPDGRCVTYYVRDNGLGIPASALPELFTAFRRFHPQAGPGEGMGLLTVRRIVERHHGKVRVESELGEGSTFLMELPAEGAAET